MYSCICIARAGYPTSHIFETHTYRMYLQIEKSRSADDVQHQHQHEYGRNRKMEQPDCWAGFGNETSCAFRAWGCGNRLWRWNVAAFGWRQLAMLSLDTAFCFFCVCFWLFRYGWVLLRLLLLLQKWTRRCKNGRCCGSDCCWTNRQHAE